MNGFSGLSAYISENTTRLANEIVNSVLYDLNIEIPDWEKEQAVTMYITLLEFFSQSLSSECENQKKLPDTLIEWSKKNGEIQAAADDKISEIIVRYPPTREIFIDMLTDLSVEFNFSLRENVFVIKRINALLDVSLNETILAYEELSIQYKKRAEKEMAALSAPIVPVKDNVVVLPLIGEINEYRADYIMKYVISEIADMDIDYVIADFSGIGTLNMETAASLHQIGKMLRLMGIRVITTGLRPETVLALVRSGIDMSTSRMYTNVKQALENLP